MNSTLFHADDWGLSPAINEGILELARRGKLRSASCMANAGYLENRLEELRAWAEAGGEIYLHLCLTHGRALSTGEEFPSHKRLMAKSALGLLAESEMEREIEAQLVRLERAEVPVTGVNGHHHVHLLPGIAKPLQSVMLRRGIKKLLILEDSDHRPSYLQSRAFRLFGGPEPGIEIVRCGYLLPKHRSSPENLRRKLEGGILPLLVHPALWNDFAESGMTDPLREQRIEELNAIMGFLNG